jgi:hypothetical protein
MGFYSSLAGIFTRPRRRRRHPAGRLGWHLGPGGFVVGAELAQGASCTTSNASGGLSDVLDRGGPGPARRARVLGPRRGAAAPPSAEPSGGSTSRVHDAMRGCRGGRRADRQLELHPELRRLTPIGPGRYNHELTRGRR